MILEVGVIVIVGEGFFDGFEIFIDFEAECHYLLGVGVFSHYFVSQLLARIWTMVLNQRS